MNKADSKKSFPRKLSKKYPILVGIGILVIMIAHFVMQMSFIEMEQFRDAKLEVVAPAETSSVAKPRAEVEKPVPQVIEIVPEVYEIQPVKVNTIPEKVKPVPRRQVEDEPPIRTKPKKKAVRKTKKEMEEDRLRRAEKILTGY